MNNNILFSEIVTDNFESLVEVGMKAYSEAVTENTMIDILIDQNGEISILRQYTGGNTMTMGEYEGTEITVIRIDKRYDDSNAATSENILSWLRENGGTPIVDYVVGNDYSFFDDEIKEEFPIVEIAIEEVEKNNIDLDISLYGEDWVKDTIRRRIEELEINESYYDIEDYDFM